MEFISLLVISYFLASNIAYLLYAQKSNSDVTIFLIQS